MTTQNDFLLELFFTVKSITFEDLSKIEELQDYLESEV